MTRLILTTALVLLVIYAVPFVVYGSASAVTGLQPPGEESSARFLVGVLVTKLGTALAFVAVFAATRSYWGERWYLYAAIWFAMFAFSEIGEAIAGRTSTAEAALGIVSEAIYAPAAALITSWLLGRGGG